MIRASNLPVLLVISLYERQQYRDTTVMEQLGDFAERYVGSLPRRLKAAGKLSRSGILRGIADVAAGFENSRRDIGAVFEIEREVGSFYKGWDDDFDIDAGADDAETGLPILDLDETEDKPSSARSDENDTSRAVLLDGQGNGAPPGPFTSSPGVVDSVRSRRSSMPSSPSPRPSPSHPHVVFHPPSGAGLLRQRRNSSIHEPSPLARLFVSPPTETAKRIRDRQSTMMQSLSMSSSGSQPLFSSNMVSPTDTNTNTNTNANKQQHGRRKSLLPAPLPGRPKRKSTHFPNPSIGTIDEGRKVSFRETPPTGTATNTAVPFPANPSKSSAQPKARTPAQAQDTFKLKSPRRSRSPSLHEEPTVAASAAATTVAAASSIGKASDVVEELRDSQPLVRDDSWRIRLDKIEETQERIEKLLSRLVSDGDKKQFADAFSEDER